MRFVPQQLQRAFWGIYGHFAWDRQKAPQVMQVLEILEGRRAVPGEQVLDAGCGTGNYAVALAEAGFQVTGIDYAAGMLARARAKVTAELADGLSFQQADLNKRLDFPDEHFDHAINISVLQVAADPAYTLSEHWRVLKPGGTLVLLHAPRPASHDLPLHKALKLHADERGVRTGWMLPLVAAKTWAERAGRTRYWTATELQGLTHASRFETLAVDCGPPVIITAEKVSAET